MRVRGEPPIDGAGRVPDGPLAGRTGNVTLIGIACRRGFLASDPLRESSEADRIRDRPSCWLRGWAVQAVT
jgi:hypothetical protein